MRKPRNNAHIIAQPAADKQVMPVTVLYVGMLAMTNYCLRFVDVSFYQVTFLFMKDDPVSPNNVVCVREYEETPFAADPSVPRDSFQHSHLVHCSWNAAGSLDYLMLRRRHGWVHSWVVFGAQLYVGRLRFGLSSITFYGPLLYICQSG